MRWSILCLDCSGKMPEDAEHSGVHEYPNIHSIHTHLIKFGELDEQKKLILIVPGEAHWSPSPE